MRKLFFTVLCMCSAIASALDMDVTFEGVKYTVNVMDHTASVSKILDDETNPTPGKIVIPEALTISIASLGSVEIPIISMDACAARDLQSLTEIEINAPISVIPNSAFSQCYNLGRVTLPEGLQEIGNNAFGQCASLTELAIPMTVNCIGEYAFYQAGIQYFYIPDSLAFLGDYAFAESSLRQIEFLEYYTTPLESVGKYAFKGCKDLKYVGLPDATTKIGKGAFMDCSKLREFCNSSVKVIESSAFENCSSLSLLRLTAFVNDIKDRAFFGCQALTEICIPKMENLGSNVFSECYELEVVDVSGWHGTIGSGTFYNCSSLKEVTWSDDFYAIPEYTFANCTSLKTVKETSRVELIRDYAFLNSGLEEFVCSDKLREIGNSAFGECGSLKKFTYGSGIERVCPNLFDGSNNLVEIGWTEGTKRITQAYSMTVRKVYIPDSAEQIESCAFAYCTELLSVSLPANVTSIGDHAFAYCKKLAEFSVENHNPVEINENVFTELPDFAVLMVPDGFQELYRNAEGWSKFSNIWSEEDIERMTGVQNIEQKSSSVTYNLNGVKSSGKGIVISNGKKYIR